MYSISLDWLSFTVKECFNDVSLFEIIAPTQNRVTATPRFGYTRAVTCTTGALVLSNPDRPNMGLHFSLSGSTLRNIEGLGTDCKTLLKRVVIGGGKISRLDLAKDAINEHIDLSGIAALAEKKLRTGSVHHVNVIRGDDGGITVYLGSRVSDCFGRVYDKGVQTGQGGDWKRIEIETKGYTARTLARHLADSTVLWNTVLSQKIGAMCMVDHNDWQRYLDHEAGPGLPKIEKTTNREQWLRTQVLPAMLTHLAEHPDSPAIQAIHDALAHYLDNNKQ